MRPRHARKTTRDADMDKLHSTDGFACTPERLDAALRPAANDDPSAPPVSSPRARARAEPEPVDASASARARARARERASARSPSVLVACRRRLAAARLLTHARQGKARRRRELCCGVHVLVWDVTGGCCKYIHMYLCIMYVCMYLATVPVHTDCRLWHVPQTQ